MVQVFRLSGLQDIEAAGSHKGRSVSGSNGHRDSVYRNSKNLQRRRASVRDGQRVRRVYTSGNLQEREDIWGHASVWPSRYAMCSPS